MSLKKPKLFLFLKVVILHKLVTIDQCHPSQYCLFSKVFVRFMYVRLFSFIKKYDLLYN